MWNVIVSACIHPINVILFSSKLKSIIYLLIDFDEREIVLYRELVSSVVI